LFSLTAPNSCWETRWRLLCG